MPQKIKNKEYFFISTYGGLHVGSEILYKKMNEVAKARKEYGNFFNNEAEAESVLQEVKKIIKYYGGLYDRQR